MGKCVILPFLRAKHRRTLEAVFKRPTQGSVVFSSIEALIVALGGAVREGAGSRVTFELRGSKHYLHRPHPGKEAKKYQIEALRAWFTELEVGL